jgi:hypothetical protein
LPAAGYCQYVGRTVISEASLKVPLDGWNECADRRHVWENGDGDLLSIHYFSVGPDLPSPPSDPTPIRQYYRELLGPDGGLVEVEPILMCDVSALWVIVKVRQDEGGMAYVASLTLPFRDCSFVVKVQCPETGITGVRDTLVYDKLRGSGGSTKHVDPYLPTYENPVLRNPSDDVEWDPVFPGHPLSRARRHLTAITQLTVSAEVRGLAPFRRKRAKSFLGRLIGRS